MDNIPQNGTATDAYLEARQWIWRTVGPVILVTGTIGNILSAIVFSRSGMRRTHVHIFFITLAVTDLIALHVKAIPSITLYGFDEHIRTSSSLVCKISWFTLFWLADSGVWILVLLTLDRTIAICYPMSKFQLNPKSAKVALVLLFIVMFTFNSHLLYGYHRNDTINKCDHVVEDNPSYVFFTKYISVWMELVVYSFLPFTILIISDTKLILCMMRTRSALAEFSQNDNLTPNQQCTRQDGVSSIIPLLIATGVQHIVTTSPMVIFSVFFHYTKSEEEIMLPDMDFFDALTSLLSTSNHALNVFTYCFSGKTFRQELNAVFRNNSRSDSYTPTEYSMSTTTV